jgi:hypothetical protein
MEEQRAADAEAARLRKQERRTAEGAALKDVEADALQRLADLRAAVAGEVRDADGIAATRAVLMATFEYFRLHHGPTEDDPAREGYLLIPKPRSSAIVDFDEDWRPVLRKQSLPLPANSDGEGLPTPSELYADLFGPIPVGTDD